MNIYSEISILKGVGPKLKEKLNKSSIYTILDLLLYFPRDYEFINGNSDFNLIDENEKRVLKCKVISIERDVRTKTRKVLTTIVFNYNNHKVYAKWFNMPFIKRNFKVGETYNLLGKFKRHGGYLEVVNPTVACNDALKNEILPKYVLKNDLTNKIIEKLVHSVLDEVKIIENLPKELLDKYNLVSLEKAIKNIHFPSDKIELEKAITRLKFQELFTYSLKLLLLKKHLKLSKDGIAFKMCEELKTLKESLPFQLTEAQSRTVREILIDEKKQMPMNRLVQGDVGSGKTIVALIALFNVYKNGYQVCMMAPTEILATQHFIEAKKILEPFGVEIELLCGSTKNKEKLRIKERISTGEPLLVIGTHALIQEDVNFTKLGMVVTDEQHRFGVEQRSKLINKGGNPDVLVMSATPIPRTLALYLYSDLDVSVIDKLPPGRKKIETKFFGKDNRSIAYKFSLEEIKKGRQVYIVCPLIEEDVDNKLNSVEKIYNELQNGIFKGITVEMLHGKMKAKEKEEIIGRFKSGETSCLISTTVIEVGVNVPNASLMIIENAERFGLAQLHQLRGRVGRGEYQSYCMLIADAKNNVTKRRMEIMVESTDGFYISEEDLKLRGTGEMFGLKQHGETGLILADVVEDMKILRAASNEAKKYIMSEDEKTIKFCNELFKNIQRSSQYICFN